jgi:ABC-type molybdate transport system ATPase subunit
MWSLVTFSDTSRLLVMIPPEAIQVYAEDPREILVSPHNVFAAEVRKVRKIGTLLNLVLLVGGIELNALVMGKGKKAQALRPGALVYVAVSPAALSTEPQEEKKGRQGRS